MSKTAEVQNEEEFVEEVKSTFDLSARLRGRSLRTDSVVVYTDEVTAERIQTLETALQQLSDMPTSLKTIANAARGFGIEAAADALDKISAEGIRDIGEYTRIEEEKAELVGKLKDSALKVELQALPQIIVRDIRRQAKKKLGIKGNVSEDRLDEFSEVVAVLALTKAITSLRDSDGGVVDDLSYEQAKDIVDYLPISESNKIDAAMYDLGYSDVISGVITDTPDF